MKRKHHVTIIRRSCLTGHAVWIYRGSSGESANRLYRKACRSELERVRHWTSTTATRTQNITRLLNDCMSELPFMAELTPQQRESALILQKLSKPPAYDTEFYNHIQEEQRRKNSENRNYDK